MSEMQRDAQSLALEADRILNDPLVKGALAAMKADIVAAWSACPAKDAEGREWMWRHLKTAEKFEAILRGYMTGAKVEAFNEKQSLMDRALRIIR